MKKLFLIMLATIIFAGCSDNEDPVVTYTVTFETEGGTPVPSVQRVEEGSTVTAPSVNPSKTGYVFLFWHLSGTTTAYNFQAPVKGDITLYAKWQEEVSVEYWQVTWELSGGEWPSDDNHATQVVKGGTLAEPNAPAKAGSAFEGWYMEAALTTKASFPYDVSTVTNNLTLYAKWKDSEKPADKSVIMTASGDYNYFILRADGTLFAIGRNEYGGLGTGDTNDLQASVQVATGVAKVYAGRNSTFIVQSDGSILGTGFNRNGSLGLGDDTNRNNFTPIPVNDIKDIAPGAYHTHLLKNDGSLWATGSNAYGQLGVGDEERRTAFTATNLTSDVVAVAAGSEHSLALKKDGTVWGAGYGYVGCLGGEQSFTTFTQLRSGAKAIAASAYHSLILMNDGTVYGSGINEKGQLGIGNYSDYIKSFIQAVDDTGAPLTNVTAIVTGRQSSFAFKSDGTLWAAGNNSYGQLGVEGKASCDKFTKVAWSGIKSISAGSIHSASIESDNTIWIYGSFDPNPYAQLDGSGTFIINDHALVSRVSLYDHSRSTCIFEEFKGCKISVKPGTYSLFITTEIDGGVRVEFINYPVSHNETVTFNLKRDPTLDIYSWVVTRSTK